MVVGSNPTAKAKRKDYLMMVFFIYIFWGTYMKNGITHNKKIIEARFNKLYPKYIDGLYGNNSYYPLHLDSKDFNLKFVVSANLASCWGDEIKHYDLNSEKLSDAVSVFIKSIAKNFNAVTDDYLIVIIKRLFERSPTIKESGGDWYGSWCKIQWFSINIDSAINEIDNYYKKHDDDD